MNKVKASLLAGSILAGLASVARADDDVVRVGLIYTLSGPAAVLGEQARNGFQLALEDLGGTLGGKKVELIIVDDEQKPEVAVSRARELVDGNKVDFVVGPIFSNILNAIMPPVTEGGAFLISTNAGTSTLAGKGTVGAKRCTSSAAKLSTFLPISTSMRRRVKSTFCCASSSCASVMSSRAWASSMSVRVPDPAAKPFCAASSWVR